MASQRAHLPAFSLWTGRGIEGDAGRLLRTSSVQILETLLKFFLIRGICKSVLSRYKARYARFTLSASPLFFGGVSSRGRLSMNRTKILHSSAEKKFCGG